ncbi:hypothetical protein JCM10212_003703 [Sporobolomyces blumeae]
MAAQHRSSANVSHSPKAARPLGPTSRNDDATSSTSSSSDSDEPVGSGPRIVVGRTTVPPSSSSKSKSIVERGVPCVFTPEYQEFFLLAMDRWESIVGDDWEHEAGRGASNEQDEIRFRLAVVDDLWQEYISRQDWDDLARDEGDDEADSDYDVAADSDPDTPSTSKPALLGRLAPSISNEIRQTVSALCASPDRANKAREVDELKRMAGQDGSKGQGAPVGGRDEMEVEMEEEEDDEVGQWGMPKKHVAKLVEGIEKPVTREDDEMASSESDEEEEEEEANGEGEVSNKKEDGKAYGPTVDVMKLNGQGNVVSTQVALAAEPYAENGQGRASKEKRNGAGAGHGAEGGGSSAHGTSAKRKEADKGGNADAEDTRGHKIKIGESIRLAGPSTHLADMAQASLFGKTAAEKRETGAMHDAGQEKREKENEKKKEKKKKKRIKEKREKKREKKKAEKAKLAAQA